MFFQRRCPYCFETYTRWSLLYRCCHALCEKRPDEVFEERWGDGLPRRPVIGANAVTRNLLGMAKHGVCPACKRESYVAICPNCHATLPDQMASREENFAIMGLRDSGKSVFIGVLINHLQKRLDTLNRQSDELGIMLTEGDDETDQRYEQRYGSYLRNDELPPQTQAAIMNQGVKLPLVYSLRVTRRKRGKPPETISAINLTFFDTAGEDLLDRGTMEDADIVRYLTHASGIILLIDPLQLTDVRQLLEDERFNLSSYQKERFDLPVMNGDTQNILNSIDFLIRRKRQISPKKQIPIPLALTLTKVDLLYNFDILAFGEFADEYVASHEEGFDEDEFLAVHESVRESLRSWDDGRALVDNAETMFREVGFFGVSSLGHKPERNRIVRSKYRPRHIESPLFWLLHRKGLLPSKPIRKNRSDL